MAARITASTQACQLIFKTLPDSGKIRHKHCVDYTHFVACSKNHNVSYSVCELTRITRRGKEFTGKRHCKKNKTVIKKELQTSNGQDVCLI